jgi:hypothetical protein
VTVTVVGILAFMLAGAVACTVVGRLAGTANGRVAVLFRDFHSHSGSRSMSACSVTCTKTSKCLLASELVGAVAAIRVLLGTVVSRVSGAVTGMRRVQRPIYWRMYWPVYRPVYWPRSSFDALRSYVGMLYVFCCPAQEEIQ